MPSLIFEGSTSVLLVEMRKLKKAVRIGNYSDSHLQPSPMFEGKGSGLLLEWSPATRETEKNAQNENKLGASTIKSSY